MEERKNREECRRILGVNKDATDQDLKLAYRRKAKKTHPDVNKTDPNATQKFQEVKDAYEELQKPEPFPIPIKFYSSGPSPFSRAESFYQDSFSNLEDMFHSIFGTFKEDFRDPFFDRMKRTKTQFKRRVRKTMDPFERFEKRFEDLVKRIFSDFW